LLSKMTPDTLSLLEPHLLSVPLKSLHRVCFRCSRSRVHGTSKWDSSAMMA
jgi:hypothetical protein